MTDLGSENSLRDARQGRVAHGQRFVVVEVPAFLFRVELVRTQVHRQHQVGLFGDLLAVEVEVRHVLEQRVLVRTRVLEVPDLVIGETFGLRVHAEPFVVGNAHRCCGRPPVGQLRLVGGQRRGDVGVAGARVRRGQQVPPRHQVRVHVVVHHRAVLVGPGDPVDAELTRRIEMTEAAPQTSGLDQQLDADLALEHQVLGGRHVPDRRVGNGGVDVEGRRARRPVARALLAVDRAPREGGAPQAERRRPVACDVQRRVPPPERVAGGDGSGVGEERQHEGLGVPEAVSVVAVPGQTLRSDRALLGASAGLQRVEQPETCCLLQVRVAVHLDVRGVPELVEVRTLLREQSVPTGLRCRHDRSGDLVGQRVLGAHAGPAVAEVLGDLQVVPRVQQRRERRATQVRVAVAGLERVGRTGHLVRHRTRDPDVALACVMDEHHGSVTTRMVDADQR